MVNKQTLHAGVVVAGPNGDVLVTYRGDQIQNTPDVLEFWPPKENAPSPTKPAGVQTLHAATLTQLQDAISSLQMDLRLKNLPTKLSQSETKESSPQKKKSPTSVTITK